jgi:FlaA1/EpsC-like NDP-sugar epimerase
MSVDEAVNLIVSVIGLEPQKGVFVLDMGKPKKMIEIARDLMDQMRCQVKIETIGLRPGEKLTEELVYGGELMPTSVTGISVVEEHGTEMDSIDRVNLGKLIGIADDYGERLKSLDLLWSLAR